MRRLLAQVILAAAIIGVLAAACGGDSDPTPTPPPPPPPPPPAAPAPPPPAAVPPPQTDTGGVPFKVENQDPGGSGKYLFDPKEMTFKVGDTISLNLSAETEFHTFTVDELGIDIDLEPGEKKTHTITFDKAGTFRLYCIPHEALGMEGTITVQ